MSTITAVPAQFPTPPRSAAVRPTGEMRLTRRGRLVVFTLALLVVLAAAVLLAGQATGTSESEQTETIVVGTGQTLWQIADARTDGDTQQMIAHIKQLNRLESGLLMAGQTLEVPVLE